MRAGWYPYYAGYSPQFVHAALRQANLSQGSTVLDPWNGAGTTTEVAQALGFRTLGFDLNRAMVVIATARTLRRNAIPDLGRRLKLIVRQARRSRQRNHFLADPLLVWLDPVSVTNVRNIERSIWEHTQWWPHPFGKVVPIQTPPEIAFFYTALFRALKRAVVSLKTSNPTWVRLTLPPQKIKWSISEWTSQFEASALDMLTSFDPEPYTNTGAMAQPEVRIETANACELPIPTRSVDMVLASPPYCTRIDYAVSTAVELACLGIDPRSHLKSLRNRMTGTSTIRETVAAPQESWGPTCRDFLHTIEHHTSKASRSYYLKTHLQYFHDMQRSLVEIDRCLSPNGRCVLVVQDSHYKDAHNDLPQILSEMGDYLGWNLVRSHAYPVARSMLNVNGRSRAYRANSPCDETVLWFEC